MKVRELVTILKCKTDSASVKSAETTVARIKETMARIKPAKLEVNSAPAFRQLNAVQSKINSLRSTKTVKINTNMGGAEKRIDALNRKLDRLTGQKSLKVDADTTGIDKAINKLEQLDRQQQRTARGFFKGKTQGFIDGTNAKPQRTNAKPQRTESAPMMSLGGLKGVFMALGGYAIINEIKQTADAMMSLSSRIKIVTKDEQERLRIESALYSMSNKNRSSLEDLGDLYYKTALASKRFGASQEDVLKLTDIVSKSLVIGGADTGQQKSTILQLSQALGSGVLQGDELRSLRENAPILMDAIATFFNTDVGGLKEIGAKGLLTTEKLMQAILSSGDAVNMKFAQITPTIGQAMTVLGNKFSKLILDIQNSTGIFGTIAGLILEGVELVGQAIDWVVAEFGTATPEMMGMIEDFKELWKSLQPFITALGTIFMNWVVPALKMFGRVASAVLGMVAKLLQPIADILSTIANLIATISGGLPGIIRGFDNLVSKAQNGALQQYKNIMTENNQTNNITVQSSADAGRVMRESNTFFEASAVD